MQNKPNLEDATTNVKRYITIGYVNTIALGGPKNKPNSLRQAQKRVSNNFVPLCLCGYEPI